MRKRNRRKPVPSPSEQARDMWSRELKAAKDDEELTRLLTGVGRKQGYIDAKGKLTTPDPPLGTRERFNQDIRRAGGRS